MPETTRQRRTAASIIERVSRSGLMKPIKGHSDASKTRNFTEPEPNC